MTSIPDILSRWHSPLAERGYPPAPEPPSQVTRDCLGTSWPTSAWPKTIDLPVFGSKGPVRTSEDGYLSQWGGTA